MYEVIDDRAVIVKNYLTGWFIIDVLAIMPFSAIIEAFQTTQNAPVSNVDANQFIRITRLSKLYKLVKITRLFRLFKFMQNRNKVVMKLTNTMKLGMAFERLTFFMMCLLLLNHFIGCIWIFIARTF